MSNLPFAMEFLGLLVLLGLIFDQVVIPIWCGTRLFPGFSRARRKMKSRFAQARNQAELVELEGELNRRYPPPPPPAAAAPSPPPPTAVAPQSSPQPPRRRKTR